MSYISLYIDVKIEELSYLGYEATLDGSALLVSPLVPQRPAQDVADDQDLAAPGHSRDAQGSSGHGPFPLHAFVGYK